MSKISEITIYNCENGEHRRPRRYLVTLLPASGTVEYRNLLRELPARSIQRADVCRQLMDKLEPLSRGAQYYEATYRKRFHNAEEYHDWRCCQAFEDSDVRWRICFTFSDGTLWMFLCTSDCYCPEVFDDVERFLRQFTGHGNRVNA